MSSRSSVISRSLRGEREQTVSSANLSTIYVVTQVRGGRGRVRDRPGEDTPPPPYDAPPPYHLAVASLQIV